MILQKDFVKKGLLAGWRAERKPGATISFSAESDVELCWLLAETFESCFRDTVRCHLGAQSWVSDFAGSYGDSASGQCQ